MCAVEHEATDRILPVLRFWSEQIGPVAEFEPAHEKPAGLPVTAFALMIGRGDRFILKDVTGKPNAGRLDVEARLLRHLRDSGVPVAVPILTDDKSLFVEERGLRYVLYPALPVGDGDGPPVDVDQIYFNIGAALARLHKALATFSEPIASWTMDLANAVFTQAVPQIETALTGAEATAFHAVVDAIRPEMTDALAGLPVQIIHGDCHGGNFLLYRGDVSGFIDLDHLPQGPRAYDIGYLLADMAKARFVGNHAHADWLENFDQVLAGYEQESKLSQRERHAISYTMLATQLLMACWLFKHGNSEIAFKNLEGFYWIYQHRDDIARRIPA